MQVNTIPNYYFTQQMPNHEKVKEALLEAFLTSDFEPIFREGERISISDWKWSMTPRNWAAAFKTVTIPLAKELIDYMHADNAQTSGYWFQQYFAEDFHGWHVHTHTNYSAIYLLECPDGMETEFFDVTTQKIIDSIVLKEGDIITFPGNILHRSKPNTSGQRKTIVSWNTNFTSKSENNVLRALGEVPDAVGSELSYNEGKDIKLD